MPDRPVASSNTRFVSDRAEAAADIRRARRMVPPTASHAVELAELAALADAVESDDPPTRDATALRCESIAERVGGDPERLLIDLAARIRGPLRAG